MRPSFVVFDLDGTVFCHVGKPRIRPRVVEALQRVHDAGIPVLCASGRPWMMLGRQMLSASWLDWRVGLNGSDITDAHNNHVLLQPLDKAVALEAVSRLRLPLCSWDAALLDRFYFEWRWRQRPLKRLAGNSAVTKWDREGPMPYIYRVASVVPYVERADVVLKIEVEAPEGYLRQTLLQGVRELAHQCGGLEIAPMNYGIELTAPGITKATGLELVLEQQDIDPSQGVAFGDGANDLPLCQKPWKFVAMGNADPAVLAVADDVTDTVQNDGVALWLERHVLNHC